MVPVFVIFVPSAVPKTCDATWWLRPSESKKQRTREARRDAVEQAFVDDLRMVAFDLRARRPSVSRGLRQKTDAGGVPQWR